MGPSVSGIVSIRLRQFFSLFVMYALRYFSFDAESSFDTVREPSSCFRRNFRVTVAELALLLRGGELLVTEFKKFSFTLPSVTWRQKREHCLKFNSCVEAWKHYERWILLIRFEDVFVFAETLSTRL